MNIDLNETINTACLTRCKKEARKYYTEGSLCMLANSANDGMPLRCVGGWGKEKIYFLIREFDIFMSGMEKKWARNLAYFEIGSGPGRCIDRENGIEFDGTALAIIKTKRFDKVKSAVFIDIDISAVNQLNKRIQALGKEEKAGALVGDYTDGKSIARIIESKNKYGLNLVFIDPTDCSVPFSTIAILKRSGIKFDLIINVATKSDFNRNIRLSLLKPESDVRKKYERFLGDISYFKRPEILNRCNQMDYEFVRKEFIDVYLNKLRSIGFRYFGRQQIHGLYELVFASEHPLGKKFWDSAVSGISINGQRNLPL